MSKLRNSEIENKFQASHVLWEDFDTFVMESPAFSDFKIIKKQLFFGIDDYYKLSDTVVRHRYGGNTNQLTIKLRKSKKSITNRIEKDLNFSKKMSFTDVAEFLEFASFKKIISLNKKAAIVWAETGEGVLFTLSLYEVKSDNKKGLRRFIELEVEKTNKITQEEALSLLSFLSKIIKIHFKLEKPLNDSLYEIFTGKKYRLHK